MNETCPPPPRQFPGTISRTIPWTFSHPNLRPCQPSATSVWLLLLNLLAPAGMGKGEALAPPGNVVKCVVHYSSYNSQTLHYFHNFSLASHFLLCGEDLGCLLYTSPSPRD